MIIIAGLKVGSENALRIKCLVAGQNFKTHIVVFHFVVAQSNVNIDSFILSALKEKLFVNLSGLFVMSPQIMDCSQCKLVFWAFAQFLMVLHEGFFIIFFMCQMEKQSGLERAFILCFGSLSLGIIIQTKSVVTACLEDMVVIIISLSEKLIINVDGFTILSHVEVAISKPKTILYLDVDVSLTFEKCDCSDPVSGLYVVFKSGHFLLFEFLSAEILS